MTSSNTAATPRGLAGHAAAASMALGLAALALPASAQVTQSYQYDGNGRLTGVSTSDTGGTNTAAYAYDDADNRTSRSQTGSSAWALLSLPIDRALEPGVALASTDDWFSLALLVTGAAAMRTADASEASPAPTGDGEPMALNGQSSAAVRFNADGQ